METQDDPTATAPLRSDEAVSHTIREGASEMALRTGVGLLVGGSVGIVLARTGRTHARKIFAGFGGGVGFGSAWTRCSMNLEELLTEAKEE